jgi:hypothetical protein
VPNAPRCINTTRQFTEKPSVDSRTCRYWARASKNLAARLARIENEGQALENLNDRSMNVVPALQTVGIDLPIAPEDET